MVKTLKIVRAKRKFPRLEPDEYAKEVLQKRRFEGRRRPQMKIRPRERELGVLAKNYLDKIHEMQALVRRNVAQIKVMLTKTGGLNYDLLFDTGHTSLETARKGWGLGEFSYGQKGGRIRRNLGSALPGCHSWAVAKSAVFKEGIDAEHVLERMKNLNEEIKACHGALMKKVDFLGEGYLASGKKGARHSRRAYLDKAEADRAMEKYGFKTYFDAPGIYRVPLQRWMITKGVLSPFFTSSIIHVLESGLAREKMFAKRGE